MRRVSHLSLILLVCFGLRPLAINAQESSSVFNDCMTETQGMQMGVRGCSAENLSRLEAEMNAIIAKKREYQEIERKKMEDNPNEGVMLPNLSLLDKAQDTWFAFRNAQCAWEVAESSGGTARGSMYALRLTACQFEMTLDRILKLKPGYGTMADDQSNQPDLTTTQP